MSGLDLYFAYLNSLPKAELQMIARDCKVPYYGAKSKPELIKSILEKNAKQAATHLLDQAVVFRHEYEPIGKKPIRGDKLRSLIKAIDDYKHYNNLMEQ